MLARHSRRGSLMKSFDSSVIPTLGTALDAYALRQKAIASNIANVGSAGYVTKHVRFEEELANAGQDASSGIAVMRTNERHLSLTPSPANPSIEESPEGQQSSGVNDVDIDQEMADLAKNQIRFKFSSRLISEAFKLLQNSIKGSV